MINDNMLATDPLLIRHMVRFRAQSHTGVVGYDEACFMHLTGTPGVVHNFPKAVGVEDLGSLCTKKIPDSYSKREDGNPGKSGLSSQQ